MNVQTLTVGPIETNCFVVWDAERRALVVDPGWGASRILDFLERERLSVLTHLVTHGHTDHIGGLAEVHRRHPAPIAMHPTDIDWAFEPENSFAPFMGPPERPERIERMLADGQEWSDGDWNYEVIETPGHTPGAVAFHFPDEGVLFAGDTLFQGSVGRTDLPGGNPRQLTDSLKRLARLPDRTVVYPGHGGPTTIGDEKRTNYFMQYAARN